MTDRDLAIRILCSIVFGSIVGIERQWHHKSAGIKTNTLVAVGATTFGLISQYGYGVNNNPIQVAAGVVTGIGFIGAGVILHQNNSVHGLTTAATLWTTASMGLALGGGYYHLATAVLLAMLCVQTVVRWGERLIDQRFGLMIPLSTYHIVIGFSPATAEMVRQAWLAFAASANVNVTAYREASMGTTESLLEATINIPAKQSGRVTPLCQQLATTPGVLKVSWTQSTDIQEA